MVAAQQERVRGWLDGALLLVLTLLLLVEILPRHAPHSFLHGDGAFYANINRGIRDDLGLAQGHIHPRSWIEDDLGWNRTLDQGWSNVSLGVDGETWYPKHPYLMPLVATPLFVLLGMSGLLVFNVLMTLLLLYFGYRVAARFASPVAAALATLLAAGSPVILSSAYSYSNDVFYAALLLMGLEALLARRPVWAGLLMGLALWAKVTNLLFIGPLVLWFALAGGGWAFLLRFGYGFAGPVLLFALGNWIQFGAPWHTSYDRILIRQDGLVALESARVRFGTPLGQGLRNIFGTGPSGLLRQAPLSVVALAGIVPLALRRWGLATALLASFVAYALVFAPYEYVYARFYLPWFGLSLLCGAVGLDALARGGAWLRERAWPSRRVATLAGFAAFLLVVGFWLALGVGRGEERRLSEHVGSARVELGDVPCDYFNNALDAWECAQRERHAWEYAGRPLDERCQAMGFPDAALWLHPSPRNAEKRMRFPDLPPTSRLRVVAMRAPGQKGRPPSKLELLVEGQAALSLDLQRPGAVEERLVDSPALSRGGGSLELRVAPAAASRSELGLCVEVFLEP